MKSNIPEISDEELSPDILDAIIEGNSSKLAIEIDENEHYDVCTRQSPQQNRNSIVSLRRLAWLARRETE